MENSSKIRIWRPTDVAPTTKVHVPTPKIALRGWLCSRLLWKCPVHNFTGLHAVPRLATTLHIDMGEEKAHQTLPRGAKFTGTLTLNA